MTVNKTAQVQHDTPTKNRFIGAMEATGNLRQSAARYGIKPSTASDLWAKYVTPQRGILVRHVQGVQDKDRMRLVRHSVR